MDDVIQPIADPDGFVIRLDADTVVGICHGRADGLHFYRSAQIGELDPMNFLAGREIGDYKSVKVGQSCEDPLRRTVRIRVERQWTRTVGELNHTHGDRKSTRLNSSHSQISYAVFC